VVRRIKKKGNENEKRNVRESIHGREIGTRNNIRGWTGENSGM